jgi:hypothetical protein
MVSELLPLPLFSGQRSGSCMGTRLWQRLWRTTSATLPVVSNTRECCKRGQCETTC